MKDIIDPNLNSDNNEIDMLLDEILSGKKQEDVLDVDKLFKETQSEQMKIVPKEHTHHEHRHTHHHNSSEHHHSSHSSSHHHHSSHSHHSHHGKHKKKKKNVWIKVLAIILALIIAFVGCAGAFYYYSKSSGKNDMTSANYADTQHEEIITYKGHEYQFNKDVVSIAFMGVDQRALSSSDNTDFVGCADADIIIAIDTKTGKASIISMPRDTMVDVDQYNGNAFIKTDRVQLCLAYAYGDGKQTSCTNVTSAMSRILYNIPIDKYFALDLEGIKPLNDAIGGVTIESSLYDLPEYGIHKGDRITLKGDLTEAYVRTRDMDRIDASINRKERQEQYLRAFANQLLPKVKEDFGIITRLYNTASDYSQTNISLNNVTYLASLLLTYNITDFTTYTYTGEWTESKDTLYPDYVHAELNADEESIMETVLAVYYTQIS